MPSCDSNIRFVYFRAKGARARVHFPATYFLYFVVRFAQTPSLFFVNIMQEKTSKRTNVQLRYYRFKWGKKEQILSEVCMIKKGLRVLFT